MPKPKLPRPTDFEVSILRVLWKRGPSTVREVAGGDWEGDRLHHDLENEQLMTEKGWVGGTKQARTHIYKASRPAEETQRHLIRDLVDRAFTVLP